MKKLKIAKFIMDNNLICSIVKSNLMVNNYVAIVEVNDDGIFLNTKYGKKFTEFSDINSIIIEMEDMYIKQ